MSLKVENNSSIAVGSVTKQQIEQAKQMDLLTYMMTYEPQVLMRVGAHDYKTRTHDSLCISDILCVNHQFPARGFRQNAMHHL